MEADDINTQKMISNKLFGMVYEQKYNFNECIC